MPRALSPASLTASAEASETFSGVFWSFRGLGAAAAACEVFLVPGQTWPASLTASAEARKFSWYPARLGRRP